MSYLLLDCLYHYVLLFYKNYILRLLIPIHIYTHTYIFLYKRKSNIKFKLYYVQNNMQSYVCSYHEYLLLI